MPTIWRREMKLINPIPTQKSPDSQFLGGLLVDSRQDIEIRGLCCTKGRSWQEMGRCHDINQGNSQHSRAKGNARLSSHELKSGWCPLVA